MRRRRYSRTIRCRVWLAAAAVALLSGIESPPAAAKVDTNNPVDDGHPVVAAIPSLHVDGDTFSAGTSITGPTFIHEGVFSNGIDLPGPWQLDTKTFQCNPATTLPPPPNAKPSPAPPNGGDFVSNAISTQHTSTSALQDDLRNAICDASSAELPKLDAGVLNDLLSLLADLGAATATGNPTPRFLTFPDASNRPEFGRWLRDRTTLTLTPFLPHLSLLREQHQTGIPESVSSPKLHLDRSVFGFGQQINYSDPIVMANLRERGARLYCAARQAQNLQSSATKSMGRLVPFSLNLLGQEIDFLVVEPTLVIDGPQPYIDPKFPRCPVDGVDCANPAFPKNDGAQAFMIPFLVGTQITPVSLLPSLAEIRSPLVMVTGDSEVVTTANLVFPDSVRHYQTASHTDAILSQEIVGGARDSILLFTIGPVQILLDFGLGFDVGQLYSDEQINFRLLGNSHQSILDLIKASAPGTCLQTNPSSLCSPTNDRVLAALMPPFPSPLRIGDFQFGASYGWDEGAWLPALGTANTTLTNSIRTLPDNAPSEFFNLRPFDPMLIRGFEDDDRHTWVSTTLGLFAGIEGKLPDVNLSFSPLGSLFFHLAAAGDIRGDVAMRHTLRDAAIAVFSDVAGPKPISAASIEPTVSANAAFSFEVQMTLTVTLQFYGTLTIFDGLLIDTGDLPLAEYSPVPFDESHRFRLGTGADLGDPLKSPKISTVESVPSHFPSGDSFASFPPGGDVDSCLTDASPNNPPPPPCGPGNVVLNPPHSELCVYGGNLQSGERSLFTSLPANVCTMIGTYVPALLPGGTVPQQDCLFEEFDFLCHATSKEQSFSGNEVVAHVIDPSNNYGNPDMRTIFDITKDCVNAFAPGGTQQQAQAIARALFGFAICDSNANLMTQSQVISRTRDPNIQPTVQPGQCM